MLSGVLRAVYDGHSVQSYRCTLLDLLRRSLAHIRSKQIQCSLDIFLAIFFKNTPCTAMRHALNRRYIIKLKH